MVKAQELTQKKSLRELWDAGRPTVGGWCSIPSSITAEIMAASFDWVCIDMQHGFTGQDYLIPMLQSLAITGTPGFVRVPWHDPGDIMRALDIGAQGVIVPMVNSADEARAAVGACRYAPEGYRSWGPTRRALYDSGLSVAAANREVICAVMIETARAVEALDEIVAVPGVDAIFVGPNDLAVSIGIESTAVSGDGTHERLIRVIADTCSRHGVVAGIFSPTPERALRYQEYGYSMLAMQTDYRLLRAASESLASAVRGGLELRRDKAAEQRRRG